MAPINLTPLVTPFFPFFSLGSLAINTPISFAPFCEMNFFIIERGEKKIVELLCLIAFIFPFFVLCLTFSRSRKKQLNYAVAMILARIYFFLAFACVV